MKQRREIGNGEGGVLVRFEAVVRSPHLGKGLKQVREQTAWISGGRTLQTEPSTSLGPRRSGPGGFEGHQGSLCLGLS